MTDLEAIEKRTSRRSYRGQLDSTQARRLEEVAAGQNLDTGLSIRLEADGSAAFAGITNSYGMFTGVHGLLVLAGPAHDGHLKEKAGRAGERLVLEATKLGLGTCWVAGTYNRELLSGGMTAGQELVAVITVGPVKEGKGLVERAVGRVVSKKSRQIEDICEAEEGAPQWFFDGVKAAMAAPSAVNRMPTRFLFKDGAASAMVPATEAHQLIDLGIAKLHFEIGAGGRFALGNGALFVKE